MLEESFNVETWLANEKQAFIVRIDSSGNQVYLKRYEYFDDDGNRYDCTFNAVKEDSDGYLVACGNVGNDQVDSIPVSPWLVRVNAEGCFEDGVDCEISDLHEEEHKRPLISLYPNPTMGEVTLKSDQTIESTTLYSIHGQKILNSEQHHLKRCRLNLEEQEKGVYTLIIALEDGSRQIKRIVKH